jgi:heme-degrading monooxygenase HmoA
MFIAIINFPIKPGKDEEFLQWFDWSNKKFSNHEGLLNRRLLKPLNGGDYIIIIEHESLETFMAGHKNPEHDEVNRVVEQLLDGKPNPQFFNLHKE